MAEPTLDTEKDAFMSVDDDNGWLPSTEYAGHGTCYAAFMRGDVPAPSGLGENDKTDPVFGKISDYTGPYGGSDS